MRYFLQIAYQGTHYHGWQIQPNALTVQEVIQEQLKQILRKRITLVGSSRTDAGVHAQQQWAHMDLASPVDTDQLRYQLNATLPPDVAVHAICPVQPTAHARFDALSRTYEYTIVQTKDPFLLARSYVLSKKLAIEAMNEAVAILYDKKDFESFSKIRSGDHHYRCTVTEAQWIPNPDGRLIFRIQANRFLRGMVRSIVSNLLQVGLGKSSVSAFETLTNQKNRSSGTSLMPPYGLTLTKVTYPAPIFIKEGLIQPMLPKLSLTSLQYAE